MPYARYRWFPPQQEVDLPSLLKIKVQRKQMVWFDARPMEVEGHWRWWREYLPEASVEEIEEIVRRGGGGGFCP